MPSRVAASGPVRHELGVIWDAPLQLDPPPGRSLAFALAPRITAATVIAALAVGGPGPAIAIGKDKPVNPVIALPPSPGGEVGADDGVAAPGDATEEDQPDDDGNTAPPPTVEPEPPTVVDTGPEPAVPPEPEPPVAAPAPEPPAAVAEPPAAVAEPPAPVAEPPAPVAEPPAPAPEPELPVAAPEPPPPAAEPPVPAPTAAPAPAEEPAPAPARAEAAPAPPRITDAGPGTAPGVAPPSAKPVSTPAASTTRRTALQDPAPVSTRAAAPRPSGTRVVVRRGDSLWLIASRLAGPVATDARVARLTSELWDLNAARIGTHDPNLLPVGVTLDLPTL